MKAADDEKSALHATRMSAKRRLQVIAGRRTKRRNESVEAPVVVCIVSSSEESDLSDVPATTIQATSDEVRAEDTGCESKSDIPAPWRREMERLLGTVGSTLAASDMFEDDRSSAVRAMELVEQRCARIFRRLPTQKGMPKVRWKDISVLPEVRGACEVRQSETVRGENGARRTWMKTLLTVAVLVTYARQTGLVRSLVDVAWGRSSLWEWVNDYDNVRGMFDHWTALGYSGNTLSTMMKDMVRFFRVHNRWVELDRERRRRGAAAGQGATTGRGGGDTTAPRGDRAGDGTAARSHHATPLPHEVPTIHEHIIGMVSKRSLAERTSARQSTVVRYSSDNLKQMCEYLPMEKLVFAGRLSLEMVEALEDELRRGPCTISDLTEGLRRREHSQEECNAYLSKLAMCQEFLIGTMAFAGNTAGQRAQVLCNMQVGHLEPPIQFEGDVAVTTPDRIVPGRFPGAEKVFSRHHYSAILLSPRVGRALAKWVALTQNRRTDRRGSITGGDSSRHFVDKTCCLFFAIGRRNARSVGANPLNVVDMRRAVTNAHCNKTMRHVINGLLWDRLALTDLSFPYRFRRTNKYAGSMHKLRHNVATELAVMFDQARRTRSFGLLDPDGSLGIENMSWEDWPKTWQSASTRPSRSSTRRIGASPSSPPRRLSCDCSTSSSTACCTHKFSILFCLSQSRASLGYGVEAGVRMDDRIHRVVGCQGASDIIIITLLL